MNCTHPELVREAVGAVDDPEAPEEVEAADELVLSAAAIENVPEVATMSVKFLYIQSDRRVCQSWARGLPNCCSFKSIPISVASRQPRAHIVITHTRLTRWALQEG